MSLQNALNELQSQLCKPMYSDWHAMDQDRIAQFADVTVDHQYIHLDADRVRAETPLPGTIAHGFLTLSMASRFYYDAISEPEGMTMSLNYGFDKVRFLTPVLSGSQIRGVFDLQSVEPRGENALLTDHALTIEIQNETRPALVARWLTLLQF